MSREIEKVWVIDPYLNQVKQKTPKQVDDDNRVHVRYPDRYPTRQEAECAVTARQVGRVVVAEERAKKERDRLAKWEKKLAALRAVGGEGGRK